VAEQLAAHALAIGKDYELDCMDPYEQIPMVFIVDDTASKITNQVLMGQFFLTDVKGLVINPPQTKTLPTSYECPADSTKVVVDFEQFTRGQYVDKLTNTVSVKAVGNNGKGYTPSGMARIFDSANPNGADVDLGSPNYACGTGGPGQGEGGRPSRPGANCKSRGNLLIVQESNTVDPDALGTGGKFTFTTDGTTEFTFLTMGVLDHDETTITIGDTAPIKFPGVGDNGYQLIANPDTKTFVKSFDVATPGSGALTDIVSVKYGCVDCRRIKIP
jgi:hypothetical protein